MKLVCFTEEAPSKINWDKEEITDRPVFQLKTRSDYFYELRHRSGSELPWQRGVLARASVLPVTFQDRKEVISNSLKVLQKWR